MVEWREPFSVVQKSQPPAPPKPLAAGEIKELLEKLKNKNNADKQIAAGRLCQVEPKERREEVAKALEAVSLEEDYITRSAALKALCVWATKENVPTLIQLLDCKDIMVHTGVIKVLEQLKDERSVEPLAQKMVSAHTRKAAIQALKSMGNIAEKAVGKVLLNSKDIFLRREACLVLKEIGTKASLDILNEVCKDTNGLVRSSANEAVQAIASRKS